MRFYVESWAPDFGSPVEFEDATDGEHGPVDLGVEVPPDDWAPITPAASPARTVAFVDGVQRIDARLWVADDHEQSRMGACVSMAAGVVICDGTARVQGIKVKRFAFAPSGVGSIGCGSGIMYTGVAVADLAQTLDTQLRRHREDLEVEVALSAPIVDLLVLDGHVRGRETIPGAVGYLKSHHAQYLPPEFAAVVSALRPGQRCPVFLLETAYSHYSWYVRLPGGEGHPWAGVVRCEASPSLSPAEVKQFADVVTATLPRFASQPHKDSRAPQNLYPIAGLERETRRRLGDQALLYRRLQVASRAAAEA
jgi:hypothetical protein